MDYKEYFGQIIKSTPLSGKKTQPTEISVGCVQAVKKTFKEMLNMIKLRLSGTKTQLAKMLQLLRTGVEVIDSTEPIQNSHSNLYRIYVTVQDIEEGQHD